MRIGSSAEGHARAAFAGRNPRMAVPAPHLSCRSPKREGGSRPSDLLLFAARALAALAFLLLFLARPLDDLLLDRPARGRDAGGLLALWRHARRRLGRRLRGRGPGGGRRGAAGLPRLLLQEGPALVADRGGHGVEGVAHGGRRAPP